jgi:hypothetical protein
MAALAKRIPIRPPPFEEAFAKKAHAAGAERGTESQLFTACSGAGDEQAAGV